MSDAVAALTEYAMQQARALKAAGGLVPNLRLELVRAILVKAKTDAPAIYHDTDQILAIYRAAKGAANL